MHNQRQQKRWDCSVPVEGGRDTDFDGARSLDFSSKGMGFVTHMPVALNKTIAVAIDLDGNDSPVLVRGRVAWVQSIPGTSNYRVGLAFEETVADGQNRLDEYFEE